MSDIYGENYPILYPGTAAGGIITVPTYTHTITLEDTFVATGAFEGRTNYDPVSSRMVMVMQRPTVSAAPPAETIDSGPLTDTFSFEFQLPTPIITTAPPGRRVLRRGRRAIRRNL